MKSKKTVTINSEGDLTIHKITELHMKIQDKLNVEEKLIINIKELKDIDLAGIQLLISLRKYHPNIECKIDKMSDEVIDILNKTGFKSLVLS